jgi:hypothetical protein
MKSRKMNTANITSYNPTPTPHEESRARIAGDYAWTPRQEEPTMITHRWHLASLLAAGCITLAPVALANGHSGGHMSGMGSHGNSQHQEHRDRSYPFWGPSYAYHAGLYDSDYSAYSYKPTPEQQATAKQQVEGYLLAIKKGRKQAATHRYISVETLRPTKKQLEDFTRRQPPTRHLEPSQLRCLMVFDTQAREFVGSGCYVVSTEPSAGEVAQFETVSAEFVGREKL